MSRRVLARAAPLALVLLLAAALLAPAIPGLRLEAPRNTRVDGMIEALEGLPDAGALVVVGFDPDLGTYAEIRPTVRALLADLLERGARLAVVTFTPEGRALGVAELDRLGAAVDADRLFDLGFRPGAEAALVRAVQRQVPDAAGGPFAPLAEGGLGAADLALVIGGNDLGPRSWVEQVATRLPDLPLAAVTPTVLLPELQPYLATGQLDGLLGTIQDGAAYRASLGPSLAAALGDERPIGPLPVLAGMLVALGLVGQALAARVRGALRAARS